MLYKKEDRIMYSNTLNSKLIMGTDLISKIKTGDMVLSSIETMDNLHKTCFVKDK